MGLNKSVRDIVTAPSITIPDNQAAWLVGYLEVARMTDDVSSLRLSEIREHILNQRPDMRPDRRTGK